jgi:hypothetical protein
MSVRQKFWLITYTFRNGNGAYWMMTLDGKPHTQYVRAQLRSSGHGDIAITGIASISPETFRELNKSRKQGAAEVAERSKR